MQVVVNGEPQQVPSGTCLAALLTLLEFPPTAVAVALNLEVVPRSQLAQQALCEGDRVEVVRAVGGG